MLYEFRTKKGRLHLIEWPMGMAPDIGTWIVHQGKRMRRVPSSPLHSTQEETHFVSRALPKGYPYARDFDDRGRPRFSSKEDLRETVKRANDSGDPLQYDTY